MPTSPRYTEDPALSNQPGQEVVDDHPYRKQKQRTTHEGVVNMTKVFGMMFLLVLGTAAITLLLGYLFDVWYEANPSAADTGVLIILIVAGIALLVISFMMMFSRMRSRASRRSMVLSIVYAALMGVVMSSFAIWIDWEVLGITFALTAVIFGLMTLIAYATKGRFSGAAMVGMGLAMAAMILMLFGFLFGFLWPSAFDTMYMIIMGVMVIAMMLITLYDVARIRRIVNEDNLSNDVCFYCAFRLYTDFVCIFIYLLYFLVRIFARSR